MSLCLSSYSILLVYNSGRYGVLAVLWREQALSVGFAYCGGGIRDVEFFVDAFGEGGHGVGGYSEFIGNFFFDEAFAE